MSTPKPPPRITAICGYRKTKRDRYCTYSISLTDWMATMASFAEHCVRKHDGKMLGEIIQEQGSIEVRTPVNGHAD